MANRVWNGGRGDWSNPWRWTTAGTGAAGAPEPGDGAAIPRGSATVFGGQGLDGSIYDGVAVTLGDDADDFARLVVDGANFNEFDSIRALGSATIASVGMSAIAAPITDAVRGTTLTIAGYGGAPNGLLLARGASVSVGGEADLDLRGTITAEAPVTVGVGSTVNDDATLRLVGTAATIDGTLAGTGTIDVEDAATLTLGGTVAQGQTVAFGDVAGRLALADPGGFGGAIAGFKPGDSLDFTAVQATGASYDAATQTLSLTGASGAVAAAVGNVQAASGALAVAPDGSGGTFVTYAGAPTREQEQIQGADRAVRADVVRDTMVVPGTSTPITGAGVKVGIISNSFDAYGTANADAAAGYLPADPDGTSAVTVLGTDPARGSDEGREMAEEVHQIAPGAQLYFAASGSTQTSYAAAVAALQQAGCTVIANDVTALDGAMYEAAGPADVADRQAVKAGVNVFTSGGNYAQSDLEQSFAPANVTLPDGTSADAQIFDDGTPEEGITVAANTTARIDLQWTAPYEGLDNAGAPQALSFQVFRTDGTLVGTAKVATEGTADTPTTDLHLTLPTASAATTYDLVVTATGQTPMPQGFKAILSSTGTGRGPGGVFDDPEAGEGSGDERGVELVRGVNSVGASDFGNSAAFGGAPSFDEDFTSSGPGELLYGPRGHAFSAPRSAGKLSFDAPDGVPVPNPDSSEPNTDEKAFYGTSAAAPNAAAVAALMLQANPGLTTEQVTALLQASAIDQGLTPGQQGAGLIQADRAVALATGAPNAGETLQSTSDDTFINGGQPDTTFVFHPGFGQDLVGGFLVGGAGHDMLSLPSSDFASIAAVLHDTASTPGGAVIHDPATGDALTLAGVSRADLVRQRGDIALHS